MGFGYNVTPTKGQEHVHVSRASLMYGLGLSQSLGYSTDNLDLSVVIKLTLCFGKEGSS